MQQGHEDARRQSGTGRKAKIHITKGGGHSEAGEGHGGG